MAFRRKSVANEMLFCIAGMEDNWTEKEFETGFI